MSDAVDDATNMAELHLANALAKPKPSLPPLTGSCWYCDALTDGRFCDADCRDDYERSERKALMSKQG